MNPPNLLNQQFKLRDGRTLGYAEHGNLNGRPVFFFHGLPGSRLFFHPDTSIPTALGVRLITIDRPGIGLSDYQEGRKLLDWPDDVVELADALGLDRFAVAGVSAGGPYAAVCAYKIAPRLTAAAMINSPAEADSPGMKDNLRWKMRLNFMVAKHAPDKLMKPSVWVLKQGMERLPEQFADYVISVSPEPDQRLLSQPDLKQNFIESCAETYRNGVQAHITDAKVIAKPWGFRLEDIPMEVQVWQGLEDIHIPPGVGNYIMQCLPHCRPHFLPDTAHFANYSHWREILTALLTRDQGKLILAPPAGGTTSPTNT
jgi:pimeloyl-ACP methyl ester carboxylesterase